MTISITELTHIILDHFELSTSRFEEMCTFYDRILAPIGIKRADGGSPAGFGDGSCFPFWLRASEQSTRDAHFAFSCSSRAVVRAALSAARAADGKDLREPRVHDHIDRHYYAAYVRDPDGHLVEFVCRSAES